MDTDLSYRFATGAREGIHGRHSQVPLTPLVLGPLRRAKQYAQ
jgi:hypothetical protein